MEIAVFHYTALTLTHALPNILSNCTGLPQFKVTEVNKASIEMHLNANHIAYKYGENCEDDQLLLYN